MTPELETLLQRSQELDERIKHLLSLLPEPKRDDEGLLYYDIEFDQVVNGFVRVEDPHEGRRVKNKAAVDAQLNKAMQEYFKVSDEIDRLLDNNFDLRQAYYRSEYFKGDDEITDFNHVDATRP